MEPDPGSADLGIVFEELHSTAGKEEEDAKAICRENLVTVVRRLELLVFIRSVVLMTVKAALGGELSEYQWLILQLYPQQFFGVDIFHRTLTDATPKLSNATVKELFRSTTLKWSAVIVDESQVLLKQ